MLVQVLGCRKIDPNRSAEEAICGTVGKRRSLNIGTHSAVRSSRLTCHIPVKTLRCAYVLHRSTSAILHQCPPTHHGSGLFRRFIGLLSSLHGHRRNIPLRECLFEIRRSVQSATAQYGVPITCQVIEAQQRQRGKSEAAKTTMR